MFNLEQAKQNWKRKLRRDPAFEDGDIAELESHLREEIERLKAEGASDEAAFQMASETIGEPEAIGGELYKSRTTKVDATPSWKQGSWVPSLLPNYIKTTLRNIRRKPVYSFINILGLATGIACCILILIYLQFRLSFDDFHSRAEQLYRLNKVVTPKTGGTELHAITSGPMGPQMKRDYPEVKRAVRVLPWFDDGLITYEGKNLKVDDFVLVDSTFLEVFDFNLLNGDPASALDGPLSIVLNESVAAHFFGDENPVGETVRGLNGLEYTITGVIENPPDNSHISYDALISWSSTGPSALDFGWLEGWFPQAIYTYLLLEEGADPGLLESKLPEFMERHFPQRADQYRLFLQPLSEIYLHSTDIRFTDRIRIGNSTNVYVFMACALLILLIACINFINLSTARSMDRAREVGVRKVLGAKRAQLGLQFLGESVVLSFTAMALAVLLIQAGKPILAYAGIPGYAMSLLENRLALAGLLGITFFAGIASGIYPAIVLSNFQPVQVLSGKLQRVFGRDRLLRKGLVVVQFSLSIVLIIGTLAIVRQMKFVSDKSLGFQKEQILVLPIDDTGIMDRARAFEQELLRHSNIRQIAASNSLPGTGFMSYGINPEGMEQDESWTVNVLMLGDYDFLETYGLELADGRFFSEEMATDDSSAVVINEALARSLGWEEPVGKRLDIPGDVHNGRVIGVLKDFHTASLHKPIEPLILFMDNRWNLLSLRVEPAEMDRTLDYIRETWNRFETVYPFEYYFLDERFDTFYTSEKKLLNIAGIFTGLAIFIACLGLFGLSTYMVNQRTKEIGIRKVLGSTVGEILKLLSKDLLALVGLGFLIAVPAAYALTGLWLQNFAYKIDMGPGMFALAGLLAMFIAAGAVSWQSVRAARMNPVESLRSE